MMGGLQPYRWPRPATHHVDTGAPLADARTWECMEPLLPVGMVRAILGEAGYKLRALDPVGRVGTARTAPRLYARADVEQQWRRRSDWFARLDACPTAYHLCPVCWIARPAEQYIPTSERCLCCRRTWKSAQRQRLAPKIQSCQRAWRARAVREFREGQETAGAAHIAQKPAKNRERRHRNRAVEDGMRSPITGRTGFVLACWREGRGWGYRAARLNQPLSPGERALLVFEIVAGRSPLAGRWLVSLPRVVDQEVRSMAERALAYWRSPRDSQPDEAPLALVRRVP